MSTKEPSPPPDRQKKTRHRHAPYQLVALNELYERDVHPSLEQRTTLARQLGMETKTVNAWFQNKRASTKKRTLSSPATQKSESHITPPIRSLSTSSTTTPQFRDLEDELDDDTADSWSNSFLPNDNDNDHSQFMSTSNSIPKRMRNRPTGAQSHELRKLYKSNPHPSTEEKRALAERTGMRYQSITNWFQNQRSMARKRKEDDAARPAIAEARTYSAYPPASGHPSLPSLPPATNHPSLDMPIIKRQSSPSVASTYADDQPLSSSRRSAHSRRSITPYSALTRPRRSRPEPYQLDALKDLYNKTSTPSIEDRSALAQQIGMDLGRVTNWFRNLRQTSRKRAQKSVEAHEGDEHDQAHGSASGDEGDDRSFYSDSPSNHSSGDYYMDLDGPEDDGIARHHSDNGSDDEYQEEALTPASTPPPSQHVRVEEKSQSSLIIAGVDPALYAEAQKATKNFKSGVQAEDALLLLGFHQHTTVH